MQITKLGERNEHYFHDSLIQRNVTDLVFPFHINANSVSNGHTVQFCIDSSVGREKSIGTFFFIVGTFFSPAFNCYFRLMNCFA